MTAIMGKVFTTRYQFYGFKALPVQPVAITTARTLGPSDENMTFQVDNCVIKGDNLAVQSGKEHCSRCSGIDVVLDNPLSNFSCREL